MDLRYIHDDQPVAQGERVILYKGNKLYVRTGFLGEDLTDPNMMTMKYRLREIYDKAVVQPVNHAPTAADSNSSTVNQGTTP
jgi:hypothetical protein